MRPARLWLRPRGRETLAWLTAALAAVLVFSVWPALDLQVSAWCFDGRRFVGNAHPLVRGVYWAVPWVTRAVVLLGVVLALLAYRRQARGAPIAGGFALTRQRRLQVLAWAIVLGVGLLVNATLKTQSGRPRPVDTVVFGGASSFEAALSFSGPCRQNCSFVSGHAASGFVLMAWGLGGAVATRRRWRVRGLALGALVGAGRVMQGGHFLSDVVFAGLAIGVCCGLMRAVWTRWRLRRLRRRSADGLRLAPEALEVGRPT